MLDYSNDGITREQWRLYSSVCAGPVDSLDQSVGNSLYGIAQLFYIEDDIIEDCLSTGAMIEQLLHDARVNVDRNPYSGKRSAQIMETGFQTGRDPNGIDPFLRLLKRSAGALVWKNPWAIGSFASAFSEEIEYD